MECKFWLNVEKREITEAYSFELTKAATREIKKIISENFDFIIERWNEYFKK